MVMVKIWEMVVEDETVAAVDLEEAAVGGMNGKVEASTGPVVFSVASTASSPLVAEEVARLMAAEDKETTTACLGATGPRDRSHLKHGVRIATVESSENHEDETPKYVSIAKKRGIFDRRARCWSGQKLRDRIQLR